MSELPDRHCTPGAPRITPSRLTAALVQLPDWQVDSAASQIERTLRFRDYYHTIAFVNAIAFMAHVEDHHPDLVVSFDRIVVRYSTHDAGGVTENDLICAAKVDRLFAATSLR